MLGKKCVGCSCRFWKGGGVAKAVGRCKETGVDVEYDFPVCEDCSLDLERVSAVGDAIRSEMSKSEDA